MIPRRPAHESARYEGDGDPGCVGNCLGCAWEALEERCARNFRSGWHEALENVLLMLDEAAAETVYIRTMGPNRTIRSYHAERFATQIRELLCPLFGGDQ